MVTMMTMLIECSLRERTIAKGGECGEDTLSPLDGGE